MLGLIKPYKMEMLVKDCMYYKLYYCSVCRHLVKKNNRLFAFVNSYEGTLLAMLYNEMVIQDIEATKDRCSGLPLVKVPILDSDHEAIRLGAYVSLLAFQLKFSDDLLDEDGFWLTRSNLILKNKIEKSFLKHNDEYKYFDIDISHIKSRQVALKSLEDDLSVKDISIHLNAWGELFSYILSQAFSGKIDEKRFLVLKEFFNLLGKVIYLLDSMADFHDDIKSKSFNLISRAETEIFPNDKAWLEQTLVKYMKLMTNMVLKMRESLPLLELNESRVIVDNILSHSLDNEMKNMFDFMVLKRKNKERAIYNCNEF